MKLRRSLVTFVSIDFPKKKNLLEDWSTLNESTHYQTFTLLDLTCKLQYLKCLSSKSMLEMNIGPGVWAPLWLKTCVLWIKSKELSMRNSLGQKRALELKNRSSENISLTITRPDICPPFLLQSGGRDSCYTRFYNFALILSVLFADIFTFCLLIAVNKMSEKL